MRWGLKDAQPQDEWARYSSLDLRMKDRDCFEPPVQWNSLRFYLPATIFYPHSETKIL